MGCGIEGKQQRGPVLAQCTEKLLTFGAPLLKQGLMLGTKPSLRVFFSQAVISKPRLYVGMGPALVSRCCFH